MFEDTLLVEGPLPVRFVAPDWAKGFECTKGMCGLCCLTRVGYAPATAPRKHISILVKPACVVYRLQDHICSRYLDRPVGCTKYPFIIGVEQGRLNFSTCLACPSTNDHSYQVEKAVNQMFTNKPFTEYIKNLVSCYNSASSSPIWMNAIDTWRALCDAVKTKIVEDVALPLRPQLADTAVESVCNCPGMKWPPLVNQEFRENFRRLSGSYIATRFNSHNLCSIKTEGTRTNILLMSPDLNVLKNVRKKAPESPISVEMNTEAKSLLRDYFEVLINRPFISLAAVNSLAVNNQPIPSNILSMLIGSMAVFDVGATIVAMRDDLSEIDKNSLREIVSFSDAVLNARALDFNFSFLF